MKKDWDTIMRGIPTPPDSDEEDSLNVVSVQKNARRVTELLHSALPGMDPRFAGVPAKGMNRTSALFDPLQESIRQLGPSLGQNGRKEGSECQEFPPSERKKEERGKDRERIPPPAREGKGEASSSQPPS